MASHGADHQQGRAHTRGMLVDAAWAASKTPGPLRAFHQRVRASRRMQVAVVATACKLAVRGRERTLDVTVVEEYHEDVWVQPPTCPTCGQPASQSLAGPEHDWECRNEACPEFGQALDADERPVEAVESGSAAPGRAR